MRDVRKTIDKDGIDHMILTPLSLFPSLSLLYIVWLLFSAEYRRKVMYVRTNQNSLVKLVSLFLRCVRQQYKSRWMK